MAGRQTGRARKAAFLTSHFHAAGYRKTDVHFLAESFARSGWSTSIVTVGQSRAKQILSRRTAQLSRGAPPTNSRVVAHVAREAFHPPSGKAKWVERLTQPLVRFYGRRLDEVSSDLVRDCEVVLLEGGYPLFYVDAVRAIAPRAKLVGLLNDDLRVVGFRTEAIERAEKEFPRLDLVRVPAEGLLDLLPPGVRANYIPHGVIRALFDAPSTSPYQGVSKNVVSVGNMLFDEHVVLTMASARPDITIHLIGAQPTSTALPQNVRVYGEMGFEATVPFIVHADVGLAPYRSVDGMGYLAQSSMKLLQYAYCGLPVLIPTSMAHSHAVTVHYDPRSSASIAAALERAIAIGREMPTTTILDWSEVAERIANAAGVHMRRAD